MDNKDFDMMNRKLIDNYIFRQKNTQMLDDDSYHNGKKYRISHWDQKFVGRNLYTPFHRDDVMKYSKNDLRMTKVGKFNLINFTLIDLKFERMIAEHCSIMNGTFKNVEFFRFCIKGKPLSESYEASQNIPFTSNILLITSIYTVGLMTLAFVAVFLFIKTFQEKELRFANVE